MIFFTYTAHHTKHHTMLSNDTKVHYQANDNSQTYFTIDPCTGEALTTVTAVTVPELRR